MLRAHLAVVGAAFLFGSTFALMQDALDGVEPLPLLGIRFFLGGLILSPALRRPEPGVWIAGAACAAPLLAGYVFQTVGLQFTSATSSAFITYLLVVIVPVLSALLLRRRPSGRLVVGVSMATVGLFLLTGRGVGLGRGEALTLGCAVAFAFHIIVLAELAPRFDVVRLMSVQLLVVGAACLPPGLFLGGYRLSPRTFGLVATTAVVGVTALTLQAWGQRRVGPTRTSLLLMIEPVVAAAIDAVRGNALDATGVAGASLILAAIAVAEIPLTARSIDDQAA